MHNDWEELLPFYIAGTLARPDTVLLEDHLLGCDSCRKSLEQWRSIASVVRAEAASQMRDLPPLSHAVLRAAAQGAMERRFQTPPPALPAQPVSRYRATSITLIAAVFTVIVFGGLLVFMVLRGTPPPNATNTVLLSTATPVPPTITSQQSAQQTVTPEGTVSPPPTFPLIIVSPAASASPLGQIIVIQESATPTPTNTFVVPTLIPPTRVVPTRRPATAAPTAAPPPTDTPSDTPLAFSLLNPQTCALQAAVPNSVVSLYAGPGENFAIVQTFTGDDQLTALASSDNGWYQAQYAPDDNQWVGWVRQELVFTSGSCDDLPQIAAADYQTATPASGTPSAIPPIVDAPIAIINADGVNLRSGPGTNYPIIGSAGLGENYHIEAQSTSQNQIWYLITIPGARSAWIFGSLVQVSPASALIAPAMTIPPSPPPTQTPTATLSPTPTPQPTVSIAVGGWSQTASVISTNCAGEVVGTSLTTAVSLSPNGDALSMSYAEAGTPFTLFRGSGTTFTGGYSTASASVSIVITFTSAMSYSGSATVTQTDGCTTLSSWDGAYTG